MRDIGHKFLAGFFQLVDPVQHHVKGIGDCFNLTASGQIDPLSCTAFSDMLNGLFDLPKRFDHPVRRKERKTKQHHDQNDHDSRYDQTDRIHGSINICNGRRCKHDIADVLRIRTFYGLCQDETFIFLIRIRLVVSVKTLIDIRRNTQLSFVDLIGIADDIKTPVDDLNTV